MKISNVEFFIDFVDFIKACFFCEPFKFSHHVRAERESPSCIPFRGLVLPQIANTDIPRNTFRGGSSFLFMCFIFPTNNSYLPDSRSEISAVIHFEL